VVVTVTTTFKSGGHRHTYKAVPMGSIYTV